MLESRLVILTLFILFHWQIGCSQQPILVVKTFEYVWVQGSQHIFIPSDEQSKLQIKNSFVKVIRDHWNVVIPEMSLSVKPLPIFAMQAKFKTKLKDPEQGKWYLFLQVVAEGAFQGYLDGGKTIVSTLELKCRIVNSSDSVIMDRALRVHINNESAPPDQIQLTMLPAYPASFVAGFDSIATWLFRPQTLPHRSLTLKPACVFQEAPAADKAFVGLSFKSDAEGIHHITDPAFSFRTLRPTYDRKNPKNNAGRNTAAGAVTLVTGLHGNKTRNYECRADFSVQDGDSTFHCFIGYWEMESASRERVRNPDGSVALERSDYSLVARQVEPGHLNVITLDKDTLASFRLRFAKDVIARNSYHQMWDGNDPATIIALPADQNNGYENSDVELSGKLEGNSFVMKTSRERRIKDFYLDGSLLARMVGNNEPAGALVFAPISIRQLKLITILCLLPYGYFDL